MPKFIGKITRDEASDFKLVPAEDIDVRGANDLTNITLSDDDYIIVDDASIFTGIDSGNEDSTGKVTLGQLKTYIGASGSLTTEEVQDIVGAMFTSNTETRITATYEDDDGTIDLVVTDMTADTNTNQLTTFTIRDDDNDDSTVAQGKFVKFTKGIGANGVDITGSGTTVDPFVVAISSPAIPSIGDGGLTTNDFTNGDHTKLNGIAPTADVTSATNVTAAGALMDSEVTNLADVKAFDTSDYATAAQGATADSAQQPPSEGAFANGDKAKLDGIDSSADVNRTMDANPTNGNTSNSVSSDGVFDALALKSPIASPTFTGTIGIPNYADVEGTLDGIGDIETQVTGVEEDLELKANIASPTFTGTVGGITKSMVGLANVNNTSDANKPVSTATQTELDLKMNLTGGTVTGDVTLDISGNIYINADGGEARLTNDSNPGDVFVPAHNADITTKQYVDAHQMHSIQDRFYFDIETTGRTYFRDIDALSSENKWDSFDSEDETVVGQTITITTTVAAAGLIVPYDCKLKGVRWVGNNTANYNHELLAQTWTGSAIPHDTSSTTAVTATLRDSITWTNINRKYVNSSTSLDVALDAGQMIYPAFQYVSGIGSITYSGSVVFLLEKA